MAAAGCGDSSDNGTSSGGGGGGGGTVNGAGSTFAAPIYSQWGNALKDQGVTVNYQPGGSGAGGAQFAAGTVDFGASDPALAPEDKATLKKGGGGPNPMAVGAPTG